MKSVHFGAGNIGRGFIGQLLHESGYDITFVDIQDDLVDALKKDGRYDVILADEREERIPVDRVTALHSINEADEVTERWRRRTSSPRRSDRQSCPFWPPPLRRGSWSASVEEERRST